MKEYLLPLFNIIASFKDGIILEKLLLNTVSIATGNEAGKVFAQMIINKLPKLKSDDPVLPLYGMQKVT